MTINSTIETKLFFCDKCPKFYSRKEYLNEHLQQRHSNNPRIFECIYCKKNFHSFRNVQSHVRRMHLFYLFDKKIFKCIPCNKIFRNKRNIASHLITKKHLNRNVKKNHPKQYRCDKCYKIYNRKDNLMHHIRHNHISHSIKFACIHCKQRYTNEIDLRTHLRRMHSIFKCIPCQKIFQNKRNLNFHLTRSSHLKCSKDQNMISASSSSSSSGKIINRSKLSRETVSSRKSSIGSNDNCSNVSVSSEKITFFRSINLQHKRRNSKKSMMHMIDLQIELKYYKTIDNNKWRTKRPKPIEMLVCSCSPDIPCDPIDDASKCHNKYSLMECCMHTCPAHDKCKNQQFQTQKLCKTIVNVTKDFQTRGFGLFANENIQKNVFIMEYVGEIIDNDEFHRRFTDQVAKKWKNFYFLKLDTNLTIDARQYGNKARFVNHSCDPNVEVQKWIVNGYQRIGLFAKKNILKGEEITFRYDWNIGQSKEEHSKCLCGLTKCRNFI